MSKVKNLRRTVVRASMAVIIEGASYPLTGIHGGASSIAPPLGRKGSIMATRTFTPASVFFDRARVRLADGELIAASAHAREAVRRALAEKCRAAGIPVGRRSSSELLRQMEPAVDRRLRLDLFLVLRVFNRSVSCLTVKPGRLTRAIEQAEKLVAKL